MYRRTGSSPGQSDVQTACMGRSRERSANETCDRGHTAQQRSNASDQFVVGEQLDAESSATASKRSRRSRIAPRALIISTARWRSRVRSLAQGSMPSRRVITSNTTRSMGPRLSCARASVHRKRLRVGVVRRERPPQSRHWPGPSSTTRIATPPPSLCCALRPT